MERNPANESHGTSREQEKYVILEIGVIGGTPFFIVGDRKLKNNETYLAIDKRKDAAQQAKDVMKRENAAAIVADAEKMPLKDESVNEVVCTNLFGNINSFIQTKYPEVLKEAVRVLKKGGKLIINETYTPENLPKSMSAKIGFFGGVKLEDENFFASFGLEIDKKTADIEEVNQYTRQVNLHKDFFQLILKKI